MILRSACSSLMSCARSVAPIRKLRQDSKPLTFRRFGQLVIEANEVDGFAQLRLDISRGGQMTRIRGLQRVSPKQRDCFFTHGNCISNLVPVLCDTGKPLQRVSSHVRSKTAFTGAPLNCAHDFRSRPHPGNDVIILIQQLATCRRAFFDHKLRQKRGRIPILHTRSPRSSSSASRRLTGNSMGGLSRTASAHPLPGVSTPALTSASRLLSPPDCGGVILATGVPRLSTSISPPLRSSRM